MVKNVSFYFKTQYRKLCSLIKFQCCNRGWFCPLPVGVSGEGEAALGEGEEPAEGQHRGEQGEDVEAGELLDRSTDTLPHGQRTPEGGAGTVPSSRKEVQQSQETHQRLPAEVSEPGLNWSS